jgi:hypothetical protein
MKFYYDMKVLLMDYIVTGDTTKLREATALLSEELADPSIQTATLTHDSLPINELDDLTRENNCLRLSTAEVTNDGELVTEKFIRVFGADKESANGTALILKLVYQDDKIIILVPFGPGVSDVDAP